MTSRYNAYLAVLAARDAALVQLAVLAVGLVTLWYLFRLLPTDWQRRLEGLFLAIGGLVFYLSLILIIGGSQ